MLGNRKITQGNIFYEKVQGGLVCVYVLHSHVHLVPPAFGILVTDTYIFSLKVLEIPSYVMKYFERES